jgi:hypothetical protein
LKPYSSKAIFEFIVESSSVLNSIDVVAGLPQPCGSDIRASATPSLQAGLTWPDMAW